MLVSLLRQPLHHGGGGIFYSSARAGRDYVDGRVKSREKRCLSAPWTSLDLRWDARDAIVFVCCVVCAVSLAKEALAFVEIHACAVAACIQYPFASTAISSSYLTPHHYRTDRTLVQ